MFITFIKTCKEHGEHGYVLSLDSSNSLKRWIEQVVIVISTSRIRKLTPIHSLNKSTEAIAWSEPGPGVQ